MTGLVLISLILMLSSFSVPEKTPILPPLFGERSVGPQHIFSGLSTEKKTMLVRTLLEKSRAWSKSYEFKIRYQGIRELYRPVLQNPANARTHLINQYANLEASASLVSQLIQKAPKEQRSVLKKQLTLIRQQQALLEDPEGPMKTWRRNFPESPDTFIRICLEKFLETTKEIDFGAATRVGKNSQPCFTDAKYESKPVAWKFCYSAGREGTMVARNFVQAWVDEIRKDEMNDELNDAGGNLDD